MITPVKSHPELAKSQFKEDLGRIPVNYVECYGWNLKPEFDDLRLDVEMWSLDESLDQQDDYYVVMDMSYYRNWPPGVTFVNPATRTFDPSKDMRWLPQIGKRPKGIDIDYHASHTLCTGKTKQMVCNSKVLEYYQSDHSPALEEIWDPSRHKLFATIYLLQTMLTAPHYGGRSG